MIVQKEIRAMNGFLALLLLLGALGGMVYAGVAVVTGMLSVQPWLLFLEIQPLSSGSSA